MQDVSATSGKASNRKRTGGQILVDQLVLHGADTAFCVPGESYLEVLDALFDARDSINAQTQGAVREAVDAALKLLDDGKARVRLVHTPRLVRDAANGEAAAPIALNDRRD